MLDWLKLTNFSQHTDRTFVFTGGLNAMRGPNEAGKSRVISSLLYLWFGASALEDSLAETVTYGVEDKYLKVEGQMTVDGVVYALQRAKSGARISYGEHTVNGQTECTRFMERLLGGKADLIKKLIVAEQNSIRGILSSDDKAGALIEDLAELDVVDDLIAKIQAQLPTGPTKSQEMLVTELNGSTGSEPVEPSDAEVVAAKLKLAAAIQKAEDEAPGLVQPEEDAAIARNKIEAAERSNATRDSVLERQAQLKTVALPEACRWTQQDYEDARKVEADLAYAKTVEKERAVQFKTVEGSWTGTVESAQAYLKQKEKELLDNRTGYHDLKVKIATKKATKINEGVCSFCKLDISQRPEVLTQNSGVDSTVAALEVQVSEYSLAASRLDSDISLLKTLLEVHRLNMAKATPGFWEPVVGTVPCAFNWIGPKSADNLSLSESSSVIQKALRDYDKAMAVYAGAQETLKTLDVPEEVPFEAFGVWEATVRRHQELKQAYALVEKAVEAAKTELNAANIRYEGELSVYSLQVEQRKKDLARAEKARQTLLDMEFNNQLIKDLREARTDIRKKLWQSVTAAISVYFSRIRNVETVVTTGEKGFLCNGKPAKGLSGSAKDMLGLAIRAALVKTFLPQTTMMVADEPFAACDDDREVSGIGVMASLGFDQTILVTHSDLADSVASCVVTV